MGDYDALFDEPTKPAAKDRGAYAGLFDEPKTEPVDAGPSARRAAGGGSPSGPRDLTSEEAGLSSGPISAKPDVLPGLGMGGFHTSQAPEPAAAPATDYVTAKPTPGGGRAIRVATGNPNEMGDPGVQMMTAAAMGRGAGALAAPAVGAIPVVGAAAAPLAAEAVESGTANKALGGDFTTGAALPLIPKIPGALRAAAGAPARAAEALGEGAVKRVQARTVRNLTEDARKPVANQVARAAGEDGDRLMAVVERNPDLRHALAVHAKDKPAAALKAVDGTLAKQNAALDGAFEQMQAHYADKPASAQASVPQILDDIQKAIDRNKGDLDKTGALRRARTAIVDEFGADGTISPNELRSLKRSVGRAAFPAGTAASANVKAQVGRELYAPLSRQLETLAKNTPGLDAKAFMSANEDVSTLIPVREALSDKVEKIAQGRKGLIESAKHHAHKIASLGGLAAGTAVHSPAAALAVPAALGAAKVGARIGRGIDFQLAEAQLRRVKEAAAASRAAQVAPRAPVQLPAIQPVGAGLAAGTAQRQPSVADLYAPAM